MKGISPLLSGILLIAVTVTVGSMVSGFTSSTFTDVGRTTDNITDSGLLCSGASISINRVFIDGGNNGSAIVSIKNDGQIDNMIIKSAQIFDKLGNNFTFNNTDEITLNRGDIKTISFKFNHNNNFTTDISTYGRNGTCNNMPNNNCNFTHSGKYGGAIGFDGENSFINVSNLLLPTEGTLEAWIKPGSVHSSHVIYLSEGSGDGFGSPQEIHLGTSTSGDNFYFYFGSSADNSNAYSISGSTYNAGTWYHLAATYKDNDFSRLYVDGVLSISDETDKDIDT